MTQDTKPESTRSHSSDELRSILYDAIVDYRDGLHGIDSNLSMQQARDLADKALVALDGLFEQNDALKTQLDMTTKRRDDAVEQLEALRGTLEEIRVMTGSLRVEQLASEALEATSHPAKEPSC